MTVPSQGELHKPLLEIASETGKALSAKKYLSAITKRLLLTPEDLRESIPSGESRFKKNVEWGIYYLRRAQLLETPSRGHYEITAAGRHYLEESTGPITISELKNLSAWSQSGNTNSPSSIHPNTAGTAIESDDSDASPQDRIDAGYRELQNQLAEDLLDSISQISPESFERLVVDILQKMGYGKGQVVGKSGDRGIDGIINQDALGLEKVYLQAKRWQNPVGEPDIRNFIGSLVVAEGASKGVFVTNSTFSASARQTAQTTSNMFIRLIDGPELAKLMMNHDVGVITQYTYKIQKLDENYFSDEL